MLKPLIAGALLLCAVPASASTFASFDSSIGVTLQASPAEELFQGGGYLPGPSSITTIGDVTLTTGDDNGGDSCCSGDFVETTDPIELGQIALSALGEVNSVGEVMATGERRATLSLANLGASTEMVTLSFDIAMMISQAIDPLVGGAAISGTEFTISRDGEIIYNHALLSGTDDLPLNTVFGELFVYNFDLAADDETSTVFNFSLTGGVHAASDANAVDLSIVAPVPLPAAAWMLIAGLGALGLSRRRNA